MNLVKEFESLLRDQRGYIMSEDYYVEAERMYTFHCPRCGADESSYELGEQECDSCNELIIVYHEEDGQD
jgi:DNA-directed RNA polymerase subunit M/transcription elongation factor TFIIS